MAWLRIVWCGGELVVVVVVMMIILKIILFMIFVTWNEINIIFCS